MAALPQSPSRKRQIVGWRQVERQKASIRSRQRTVVVPPKPATR